MLKKSNTGEFDMEKKDSCFEGEIYSEIVELDGKEFEHIGFRDIENKFGDFMEQNKGKKVKICFRIIEE